MDTIESIDFKSLIGQQKNNANEDAPTCFIAFQTRSVVVNYFRT